MFRDLCNNVDIEVSNDTFVYFIDFENLMDASRGYNFGNLTPDYSKFLRLGLNAMKYEPKECDLKFCKDYNNVIDSVSLLARRVFDSLDTQSKEKCDWFRRMESQPVESFAEALQRILFLNQIMWQSNHRLVGLGALDMLLWEYYQNDISAGELTPKNALILIKNFLCMLHKNFQKKSNLLFGDTGQIIVVGGSVYNALSLLFIQALTDLRLPDPKILLRVRKDTPGEVLAQAVKCIATGCGSPLFSNDDVIVPKLIDFGISPADAGKYTASACWEPLIGGMDASLNNVTTLNFMRSLNNLFVREPLHHIETFKAFKEKYLQYLKRNLNAVMRVVSAIRFQYDPVLSAFMGGCFEAKKDVSHGGAKYNDIGITTVALANVINALFNIKEDVYEKKALSLLDIKKMILTDYEGSEGWQAMLKMRKSRYAVDSPEVIELTNEITSFVSQCTMDFKTSLGGRLKFGLSAPTYVDASKDFNASFDGRKKGEPFAVHISNEDAQSPTEVVNFAASLDYSQNRFNGNVVDLMLDSDFGGRDINKLVDFISAGIEQGFFQMQMNIVDSEQLISAKNEPEKFPNLIVRVWGFSAYFNHLPEEYKNVLIERALRREKAVS